ncbi:MAG: PE-PPE domain-containing protein [Mycolicibacterium sp.]|uniref:PE-PPE domain-containing protein n=1 Tax=Mycolicibacterium sp. TaxID=2320850 RepID=UPI003D0C7820
MPEEAATEPLGDCVEARTVRKVFHSLVVAAAVLFSTVVLAIGATMTSAVSLAAKAFVVPGTGTPDANVAFGYLENALNYYIAPFTPFCTNQVECDVEGVNYSASFWPLSFFSGWCVPGRCEKWDVSVEDGRANLDAALQPYLGTDEEVVIFGYSQGAAVTSNEMRYLGENYAPDQFDNIRVVNIGSIDNRVGGLWTVLGFLGYIPILDITTNLFNPISTGMEMTTINFQYDPVGTFPLYFNPLAILNALVALETVHGNYLNPREGSLGPLPYGYTVDELEAQLDCAGTNNCKKDEYGNVYVTIPAKSLPLMDALRSAVDGIGLGWLVDPFIALVEPALRVIIDTAYDPQADPGVVRYLSLLPFNPQTNLLKFGNDLFRASVQGVEDFFAEILGSSSAAVAPGSPALTVAAPETGEGTDGGTDGAVSDPAADPAVSDPAADSAVSDPAADPAVQVAAESGVAEEDATGEPVAVEDVQAAEEAVEAEDGVEEEAVAVDAEADGADARETAEDEASDSAGSGEPDAGADADTQSDSDSADTGQQAA